MLNRKLFPFAVSAVTALLLACSPAELREAPVEPTPSAVPSDFEDAGGTAERPADASAPAPSDASSPVDGVANDVSVSSPQALRVIVQPSDNGRALLDAIKQATVSIHMAMYLLSNNAIIDALVDQKKAGREVKVLLNKDFPADASSNQATFDKLKAAGVGVAWGPEAFTFSHSKCVIIDAKEAWIMTMNATQSSARSNREFMVVDREPADVAEADRILMADFENRSAPTPLRLVVSPVNARSSLQGLVAGATRTLDIAAESLSDDRLVDAINARADAGVTVRIVLSDNRGSDGQQEAVVSLKAHGVSLVQLRDPYMHAKAMVADGTRAYVGSVNFTGNSIGFNREMGVIFTTPAEVQKVGTTIAADFSAGSAL